MRRQQGKADRSLHIQPVRMRMQNTVLTYQATNPVNHPVTHMRAHALR